MGVASATFKVNEYTNRDTATITVTFREAFGVTKFEAPSSKAKRAKKVVSKRFKTATKPPPKSPLAFNSNPTSSKKKKVKKKPFVCYIQPCEKSS